MQTTAIAPGLLLEVGAAASYQRCILAGMPGGGINSAYRSTSSQRALFLARYQTTKVAYMRVLGVPRYDRRVYNGRAYWRKPGMSMGAVPGTSVHEKGRALDVSTTSGAYAWLKKYGKSHGWRQTIKAEPWHWEWFPMEDQHRNEVASVTAHHTEEDSMLVRVDKAAMYDVGPISIVPVSGSSWPALSAAGKSFEDVTGAQYREIQEHVDKRKRAFVAAIAAGLPDTVSGSTDLGPVLTAIASVPGATVDELGQRTSPHSKG